jgi:hypothetical protein
MGYLQPCPEENESLLVDMFYHVLNRGVGRRRLFDKPRDCDDAVALGAIC